MTTLISKLPIAGDNAVEPLLKYRWEVLNLPEIDGYALYDWQIHTVDMPVPKFVPDVVFAGGMRTKYAGTMDIDQFSMTFHEGYRGNVIPFFIYWMNLIRDYEGNYSLPNGVNGYKKDFQVVMKDQKDIYAIIYLLQGAWPISLSNISLDSSADPISVQVEFSVDRVFIV